MGNFVYVVGVIVLILMGWLIARHGFWVVICGLCIAASFIALITFVIHFQNKPMTAALKECNDVCQEQSALCDERCYSKTNGYEVERCFYQCSQELEDCVVQCKKAETAK